jgi:copper transport protein
MRHHDRSRARILLALAVLVAALGLPARARAHAAFLDSNPAPGTKLAAGPAQVTLDLTEPLNQSLSTAKLVDTETGATVRTRVTASERELKLVPLERLQKGAYRVDWRTVSTLDGHSLEGSFGFGVQVPATLAEGSVQQSPLARDGWLRIGLRTLLYGLMFFFAGGVLGAALLAHRRRPGEWLVPKTVESGLAQSGLDPGRVRARAWQRTLAAGWLAALAAVAVALAEAADAGGGLSPRGLSDFLLANGAGLARVGTVGALLSAAIFARRFALAAAGWIVIAFWTIAVSGHANSADPRSLAIVTDWLHLVAASVWVGGIAQLAWTWVPIQRRLAPGSRLEVLHSVLARFGRVALPAFLLVAASGLANALIQLGHPEALWQTGYGRLLAVKIAFVALIAAASYVHALRLRPRLLAANPHPDQRLERRHWRLLSVEPWLGLGAIVAVAALVAFPLPPRQLSESEEAEAAAPCNPSCPLPAAAADELPLATHAGPDIVAFWLTRSGDRLTGTMRVLDLDQKPAAVDVELDGTTTECGTGCWRFSAPARGGRLTVWVTVDGQEHEVSVPATWSPARADQARRLLARAQRTMRALHTVRMRETVRSGLGETLVTRYRFQAPDRMAYTTNLGAQLIAIGKTGYRSQGGGPWTKGPFGATTGVRFSDSFRWTIYDRSVRWLGASARTVRLALFDQATPVWYRLVIDRRTYRVLREEMIAPGHFMVRRWFAFNRPLRIVAPR